MIGSVHTKDPELLASVQDGKDKANRSGAPFDVMPAVLVVVGDDVAACADTVCGGDVSGPSMPRTLRPPQQRCDPEPMPPRSQPGAAEPDHWRSA